MDERKDAHSQTAEQRPATERASTDLYRKVLEAKHLEADTLLSVALEALSDPEYSDLNRLILLFRQSNTTLMTFLRALLVVDPQRSGDLQTLVEYLSVGQKWDAAASVHRRLQACGGVSRLLEARKAIVKETGARAGPKRRALTLHIGYQKAGSSWLQTRILPLVPTISYLGRSSFVVRGATHPFLSEVRADFPHRVRADRRLSELCGRLTARRHEELGRAFGKLPDLFPNPVISMEVLHPHSLIGVLSRVLSLRAYVDDLRIVLVTRPVPEFISSFVVNRNRGAKPGITPSSFVMETEDDRFFDAYLALDDPLTEDLQSLPSPYMIPSSSLQYDGIVDLLRDAVGGESVCHIHLETHTESQRRCLESLSEFLEWSPATLQPLIETQRVNYTPDVQKRSLTDRGLEMIVDRLLRHISDHPFPYQASDL